MTATAKTTLGFMLTLALCAAANAGGYSRAGWIADIPRGQHNAEGFAVIVDERTIRIDHFTYDGTAPAVYFRLGERNGYNSFDIGIRIGDILDRPYVDETVTVQLPVGETLDGWGAISVWCEDFHINFASALFVCPGDFDGDGEVGLSDLALLLANYGVSGGATHFDGDFDGDGDVDLSDLSAMLAIYGSICAA